jgi:5-methylcytosine-specific restriction protein A
MRRNREPLCRLCRETGLLVAAEDVDHIVPIGDAPHRRLDPGNLRSLCKSCHSVHTAKSLVGHGAN